MTLDSDIKDYSDRKLGLPSRPEGAAAAYAESPSWDIEDPSEVSIATELKDDAWQHLIATTKMLHGYVLNSATGLSRARSQAFQLKLPPGQAYTDTTMIKPEFEVFDASSITIKETKTQTERSMAQNGFSSQAISASVGVSTPYVGASVEASHKSESSISKNEGDFKDRMEYTATYNFPRARIFLDELNLEVTPECAKYLAKIQTAAAKIKKNIDSEKPAGKDNAVGEAIRLVTQFYARFGQIFACNIQLGGQLTTSKAAASFASTKEEEKRDAMQAAVAASVETKVVSASASYSKGTETEDKRRNMDIDSSSQLAWSARGGNSLLCANPAAWANSVSDYRQWRVMEQADVVALPELISKLEISGSDGDLAWPNIADTFKVIAQNEFQDIPPIPPGTWTGKLRFETLDGKKVVLKDDKLIISDSGDSTIFNVLNADKSQRHVANPQMPELWADHPVFLVPATGRNIYGRETQERGAQFVGLNVDDNDRIGVGSGPGIGSGVCRWSLRLGEALIGRNNPTKAAQWVTNGATIQHDAEVGLFCHSHHSGGSYTDKTKPTPLYAPFAVKDSTQQLKVFKLGQEWLANCAPERMKNDPRWAFLNSNRASLQTLLERSDVFQTTEDEEAQLEAYRSAFIMGDATKWGPVHELILGQTPEWCDLFRSWQPTMFETLKQGVIVALAVQVIQATERWKLLNNVGDLDPLC